MGSGCTLWRTYGPATLAEGLEEGESDSSIMKQDGRLPSGPGGGTRYGWKHRRGRKHERCRTKLELGDARGPPREQGDAEGGQADGLDVKCHELGESGGKKENLREKKFPREREKLGQVRKVSGCEVFSRRTKSRRAAKKKAAKKRRLEATKVERMG